VALASAVSVAKAQTAKPASNQTGSGVTGVLPKYAKPSATEILANRKLALNLAEKTRSAIVPTMHLVETDHFLIFSAWNWSNDAILADLCERMYAMLSQQFQVPPTEPVWIGKCPIYVFWEPSHYARFISEIDDSKSLDSNMAHANGYHATRGHFSYIVINGVSGFGATLEQKKIEFYHVLAHEGTHAFLSRYLSSRSLPLWVEEGLADYIAATLVPESEVNRKYISASLTAARHPESVKEVVEKKKDLTPAEYGIAQSLVRTLVGQDPVAMVRFLSLLKAGQTDEAAIEQSYHITLGDFVRLWTLLWERRGNAKRS
jgi:hypothetical protein